ncbi:MAG: AAA family ATPase [Pseudonocardiales bacterium]|nr:AAA family ATPase [Pseudonocardiales bacterium]
MKLPVTRIQARNFRSLEQVDVRLGPLNVLVGPNGSGKTNVLNVLRFLATTVRFDLAAALQEWGGFDHIQRQSVKLGDVELTIEGLVTANSTDEAPDRYRLVLSRYRRANSVTRHEEFTFKCSRGRGRRITVSGDRVTIYEGDEETFSRSLASNQTTGLATLPKLSDREGGLGIRSFTEFLSQILVFEPDVSAARQPARDYGATIAQDASNLADALNRIRMRDPDSWKLLSQELARCLPGLQSVQLVPVGGAARAVSVQLSERGVAAPVDLADASYGTVRLLALLAALREPDPPPFMAIEEIDHGLHPYAMDVLLDRLRAASNRTQILAATRSPTLVNRLRPEEIIVCDRHPETGASVIPAISSDEIASAVQASEWGPGELWFSGVIRGVPA